MEGGFSAAGHRRDLRGGPRRTAANRDTRVASGLPLRGTRTRTHDHRAASRQRERSVRTVRRWRTTTRASLPVPTGLYRVRRRIVPRLGERREERVTDTHVDTRGEKRDRSSRAKVKHRKRNRSNRTERIPSSANGYIGNGDHPSSSASSFPYSYVATRQWPPKFCPLAHFSLFLSLPRRKRRIQAEFWYPRKIMAERRRGKLTRAPLDTDRRKGKPVMHHLREDGETRKRKMHEPCVHRERRKGHGERQRERRGNEKGEKK